MSAVLYHTAGMERGNLNTAVQGQNTPSFYFLNSLRASLGARAVKNPPAMTETWVRPLG